MRDTAAVTAAIPEAYRIALPLSTNRPLVQLIVAATSRIDSHTWSLHLSGVTIYTAPETDNPVGRLNGARPAVWHIVP